MKTGITRRQWLGGLVGAAGLGCGPAEAGAGGADGLLAWNEALLEAARRETTPPCLLAVKLAQVHLAFHRALTASAGKPGGAGTAAAGAQAAAVVASSLYPGAEAGFRELLSRQLGTVPKSEALTDALVSGRAVGERILEERRGDGAATSLPYIPSDKPGQWRRTPPTFRPPELPHWATVVRPFLLESATQCRPQAPPELASAEYAASWDEVRRLGGTGSTERTEEQTLAARFWSDFSHTETPVGHWNSVARQIARDGAMPMAEQSRLFCLLNLTLADTAMACWDAKYEFNTWRPVTAMARAGEDGNEKTSPQPDWVPLLNTPPHPEYVSGHSAFSAAAAEVLRQFPGAVKVRIKVGSDTLPGVEREFSTLDACVAEISRSRVWGGIHFSFSCEAGQRLGRAVAGEGLRKFEG